MREQRSGICHRYPADSAGSWRRLRNMRSYEEGLELHIITKQRLRESAAVHPDAEPSMRLWQKLTEQRSWQNLSQVRADWPSADLVSKLTVFNISGNKYRLITFIDYRFQKVFIRGHLLTHAEYDRGNWKNDPWNRDR